MAEVPVVTTQISDLVPALKRELAIPGTFETVFPDTTDDDLVGALADGFAEAQLFGFFSTLTLTEDTTDPDHPDWIIDPELSTAGGALVVIYASIRGIRSQLRNIKTMSRYKAGPVEYEVQQAATVLTSELKFLMERLADILKHAKGRGSAGMATVFDNYLARNAQSNCWGGFYAYELGLTPALLDWR